MIYICVSKFTEFRKSQFTGHYNYHYMNPKVRGTNLLNVSDKLLADSYCYYLLFET